MNIGLVLPWDENPIFLLRLFILRNIYTQIKNNRTLLLKQAINDLSIKILDSDLRFILRL